MLTQEEFTKAVNELDAPEGKNGKYLVDNNSSCTKVIRCNSNSCSPDIETVYINDKEQYNLTIIERVTPDLFGLVIEYAETPVEYRKRVKHYAYIIEPHDPESNCVPVLIKEANGQWIIDKGYLYESSDGRWIDTGEDSDKVGFTDKEITECPLFLNCSMFTKLEVSNDEKTGEHDE